MDPVTLGIVLQFIVWPAIGGFIIPWLRQKTKQEEFKKYSMLADMAATYAEEVASSSGWTGDNKDKMEVAVAFFKKRTPQLPVDDIKELILSSLPSIGLGATADPQRQRRVLDQK